MYKSNKYYKCRYMYTFMYIAIIYTYVLYAMCYAYTLMSEYVKEKRKENDVI